MVKTNRIISILMAGCACAALSACGADDIASPGDADAHAGYAYAHAGRRDPGRELSEHCRI